MKKYIASPETWEDKIIWPILRAVWEPFSKKKVHWWHWKNYKGDIGNAIKLDGDRNTSPRHASIWKNLYFTNFSWSRCAVLKPKNYTGLYKRGFRAEEGGLIKTELCNVLLSGTHAGLVVGPSDTEFFALSYPDNALLELELLEITNKHDLGKDIPLT